MRFMPGKSLRAIAGQGKEKKKPAIVGSKATTSTRLALRIDTRRTGSVENRFERLALPAPANVAKSILMQPASSESQWTRMKFKCGTHTFYIESSLLSEDSTCVKC
jgi:hypothetical protein